MNTCWLSIIVTCHGPETAVAVLGAPSALLPGEVEVLVVDGHKRGACAALAGRAAKQGANVKAISAPHCGPAEARRLAVRQARGRIVFFTQAPCLPCPDILAALKHAFDAPEVGGTAGMVKASDQQSPLSRLAQRRWEYDNASGEPCPDFACAAFRRRALLEAGLFDPLSTWGDSIDPGLCQALHEKGWEITSSPNLWVRAPMPGTWADHWASEVKRGSRRFANLRAKRGMTAGEPAAEQYGHLQPMLVLLALGLLIALAPHDPARALTLAAICILLLYPLSRDFLKFVKKCEPELVPAGILLSLLRPVAWCAGMLWAAARRLGGGQGQTGS